jgi:hypothetical protein
LYSCSSYNLYRQAGQELDDCMIKIDTQMLYTHKYVAKFQGQGCNHPCTLQYGSSHLEAMCAQHRFKHINCTMPMRTEAEFFDEIQNKSLKCFPSCYSQSPLQLCLATAISSNSFSLLQFLQFSYFTL